MRSIRNLVVYFLIASLLAGLCAYPAYFLAGPELMHFEKWTTRLGLLFLILGMFPACKFFKLTPQSLGFNQSLGSYGKQFVIGYGYGLMILMVPLAISLALGIRTFDLTDTSKLASVAMTAVIGGVVVALIEESLFRGLFIRICTKELGWCWAIGLSSLIYALVHFMQPAHPPAAEDIEIWSGLQVMAQAYLGVFNADVSDLLALFAVGVLLSLMRMRSGSLAISMGMHASWVFLIKLIKTSTNTQHDHPWRFLVGQYDGVIGWLVFAWLGLLCIIILAKPKSDALPAD